ncbi:MAG: type I secretion system permease/ATPase [Pseudomonadota bacterium]
MQATAYQRGMNELRRVRARSRLLYWSVAVFSFFANLLLLTGPLYMLLIYDRVLSAGAVETLVALSLLAAFLYLIMGILDVSRQLLLGRIANRFQSDIERRVFDAMLRKSAVTPDEASRNALSHLEAIKQMLCAPALIAAMDLPWTPLFFGAIFIFHPLMGLAAVSGALIILLLALTHQLFTKSRQRDATSGIQSADDFAQHARAEAETVQALGMSSGAFAFWHDRHRDALRLQTVLFDVGSFFAGVSKTLKFSLQSGMLGLGAWLVLQDQLTAGGMIASALLLARALAPIETLLVQWPLLQQGLMGWRALAHLLGEVAPPAENKIVPQPAGKLKVRGLTVTPPGQRTAVLKAITFTVDPGHAVGVIGPSGAGKSSLARALSGVWPPAIGSILLDSAALQQYSADHLGRHIGYLPQRVALFDGTIAQNIARLDPDYDQSEIVAAAKASAVHEFILGLPLGYETPCRMGQSSLSAGQLQRIGLARALYGKPSLVVLDEPNSNLDNEGSHALNTAIRGLKERGAAVVVMTHRPAAIKECDYLLMLEAGTVKSFGPREDVLNAVVKNAALIQRASPRLRHVV